MNGVICCQTAMDRSEVRVRLEAGSKPCGRLMRDQSAMTLEGFQGLIDAYGADPRRWPESRREAGEAFLAVSAEARSLHAEALALDQLIGRLPEPPGARLSALSARIIECALAEKPVATMAATAATTTSMSPRNSGNVVTLPVRKPRVDRSVTPDTDADVARARAGRDWSIVRPAAALAASLLLGIAIGFADLGSISQFGFARYDTASLSDAELVMSGLQNDTLSLLDEDQL